METICELNRLPTTHCSELTSAMHSNAVLSDRNFCLSFPLHARTLHRNLRWKLSVSATSIDFVCTRVDLNWNVHNYRKSGIDHYVMQVLKYGLRLFYQSQIQPSAHSSVNVHGCCYNFTKLNAVSTKGKKIPCYTTASSKLMEAVSLRSPSKILQTYWNDVHLVVPSTINIPFHNSTRHTTHS